MTVPTPYKAPALGSIPMAVSSSAPQLPQTQLLESSGWGSLGRRVRFTSAESPLTQVQDPRQQSNAHLQPSNPPVAVVQGDLASMYSRILSTHASTRTTDAHIADISNSSDVGTVMDNIGAELKSLKVKTVVPVVDTMAEKLPQVFFTPDADSHSYTASVVEERSSMSGASTDPSLVRNYQPYQAHLLRGQPQQVQIQHAQHAQPHRVQVQTAVQPHYVQVQGVQSAQPANNNSNEMAGIPPDVVVAMYAFAARSEKEMSLERGDVVVVRKRQGTWIYGNKVDPSTMQPILHVHGGGAEMSRHQRGPPTAGHAHMKPLRGWVPASFVAKYSR
ncbi:hypothetical protein BC831DRAFT_468221 [Entophlyctis helioformis]|nr:hypothetical protein BC831DRAFT_468221 [Entophlyctis helioformis]